MYEKHNNVITLTALRFTFLSSFHFFANAEYQEQKKLYAECWETWCWTFLSSFLILVLTKHLFISAQPHQRHNISTTQAGAAQKKYESSKVFFLYFFQLTYLLCFFHSLLVLVNIKKFLFYFFVFFPLLHFFVHLNSKFFFNS